MTASPFLLKTSFILLDQQKKPALLPVHRRIRLYLIVGRSPQGRPTLWGLKINSNCCARNGSSSFLNLALFSLTNKKACSPACAQENQALFNRWSFAPRVAYPLGLGL